MALKRDAKRIVASIAMEVVLEGIRGYLEELLTPVTAEQVYDAILQDVDPWTYAPLRIKDRGSTWARKMRKYQDRITPQLVLGWLQEDRPDIHNLIINMGPKGKHWLASRVSNIKSNLWPPEGEPPEGGLRLVKETPEIEEEVDESPEEEPKVKWG